MPTSFVGGTFQGQTDHEWVSCLVGRLASKHLGGGSPVNIHT